MPLPEDPVQALAGRLRELRRESWPGRTITQNQLARALSAEESASVPLISSWESSRKPAVPPPSRLEALARFFATERSVASHPFRLLPLSELADQERARRDELLRELTELREAAALGPADGATARPGPVGGFWRFPADQVVTIVCGHLPPEKLTMPFADPADPDHVELYRYADLDALLELHGHIRAANPTSQVNIRTASELVPDDYTTHLAVLGGVDWNLLTRDLLQRLEIPVRQLDRPRELDVGGFEVTSGGVKELFTPVLKKIGDDISLIEDVAHVYRGPNPFNDECTVTICNGMFGRGTLGATRVFTDARFRDRNEEYVQERFADADFFSIITRVRIVNRKVVTPNWKRPDARLYEWPERVPPSSRLASTPAEQARRRRTPQLLGC